MQMPWIMDAVVWNISSQLFWGYLALILPSFFLALYYLYYQLFVVNKPRVVGAGGELHKMVIKCCPTLSSYYWPTVWAFHCHLTTILRAVLQKAPNITYKRELFTLMDGGEVALDWVDPWREKEEEDSPVLLILPGITGCSADTYIKHLVQDGLMEGYRAVVFNQRGTGGVDLKTLRLYSGTDISDVKEVIKRIQSLYPHALVVGVGVSLGGMILTQYLHQTGEQCRLHAVLTISTAWDSFKTQESLENNFMNKILYSRFLTNEIKKLVRRNLKNMTPKQIQQLPSSIEQILQCQTVSQFDTLVTAPQFGYASLHDYYAACSNWDKLYRIQRPLFCIMAADDPFVPKESLPFAEFESNLLAVLVVTSHGGHFGFLEGLLPTQHTWMDRVSREYLRAIKNFSCI